MATNDELINDYIETRGLKHTSRLSMRTILKDYTKFHNLTLQELLDEAELDEENKIRWKNRKLKKRLTNYMLYLKSRYSINSAITYLTKVKSFYYHNDIEIHKLPSWNLKNVKAPVKIKYNDLPTREIIKTALDLSNPVMRCLILFLSSTGVSRIDALTLFTIRSFIEATFEYHNTDNTVEAIEIMLESDENIIPTFEGNRVKTNKYFVTFCTPECTIEILHYLHMRLNKKGLNDTDPLFKIHKNYYSIKFKQLNDAMGLGNVGYYSRFRGHMLRKFHASNLKKGGMSVFDINILQGKSNNRVNDVYFFTDITDLKKKYIEAMPYLYILTEVSENNYLNEYLELEQENSKLIKQLEEYKDLKSDVEEIKKWFR